MIRIEETTYGESVISTPSLDRGDPRGPILNGITYMVCPGNWFTIVNIDESKNKLNFRHYKVYS